MAHRAHLAQTAQMAHNRPPRRLTAGLLSELAAFSYSWTGRKETGGRPKPTACLSLVVSASGLPPAIRLIHAVNDATGDAFDQFTLLTSKPQVFPHQLIDQ